MFQLYSMIVNTKASDLHLESSSVSKHAVFEGQTRDKQQMQMTATCLEAIRYSRRENTLSVLDQLKLPQVIEYVEVKGVDDAWTVIRQMQVRIRDFETKRDGIL